MLQRLVAVITLSFLSLTSSQGDDVEPQKFEKAIAKIEQQITSGKAHSGGVLFIGSSSIRLWDLKKSFPEKSYNNHGFGGSHVSDSVHFFHRVVTPVKPRAIVFYAGDNDLAGKKTPETVVADFKSFVALVEQNCPECQAILFIAVKPSIKRWELREMQRATNVLIREFTQTNPKLHFVDVWDSMLGEDGHPRKELFVEDGLHMTPAGYEIWTRLVDEKLSAILKDSNVNSIDGL